VLCAFIARSPLVFWRRNAPVSPTYYSHHNSYRINLDKSLGKIIGVGIALTKIGSRRWNPIKKLANEFGETPQDRLAGRLALTARLRKQKQQRAAWEAGVQLFRPVPLRYLSQATAKIDLVTG
jgi:hypothetical protein